MNTNEEIKHLFKLYLEGNTSPAQEERLFAILSKEGLLDASFEETTTEMWVEDVPLRDGSLAAQAELQAVWNRIGEEEQEKKRHISWLKYAASLFLVCTAALIWYSMKIGDHKVADTPAFLTKSTKQGERLKLVLPDSSVVYLNGGSKLSFAHRFEKGKHREIYLEGEAFFEVKQDINRPFIVHTGHLQTRVLGTSFNVDAYPGNGTYSISVRTGRVGVSAANDGGLKHLSFLTPGKQLVYQLKAKLYNVNELPAESVNAWTESRFVFKNELLSNIILQLERSYKISFKLKNPSLLKCRFNAVFQHKTIKEIAEQLQLMSGGKIHYQFNTENTIITLWGEACE